MLRMALTLRSPAFEYVFRLLAVDEPGRLTGLPSYRDVEAAVAGHVLGEVRLTGTYQR